MSWRWQTNEDRDVWPLSTRVTLCLFVAALAFLILAFAERLK